MRVEDSIRYLSRDIIKGYVKFIQRKVADNDTDYILTGVDKDFEIYEKLFIVVMQVVFNKGRDYCGFKESVVEEIAGVIDILISESKYGRIMKKYSEGVYDTCLLVYKKVENGVIGNV